jgi:hypothetical protein
MEQFENERDGRGPNTPGESLPAAIQLLQQVRDKLGFGTASRESVAEALGYRSLNGTSRRKIAALTHFELLDRNGAVYRISEIGKQILMPRDTTEYRSALGTAARKPAFYQKLATRFEGQAVPGLLTNILVREYGVLPQTSEEAARLFRESMEFAGLLRNGILLSEPEAISGSAAPNAGEMLALSPTSTGPTTQVLERKSSDGIPRQRYTIPLDKAGSVAAVELPIPIRERDLKKILAWLNYMVTVLDDDPANEGEDS